MNTKVETGSLLEQYDFLKELYYELEQLEISGKQFDIDPVVLNQVKILKNCISDRMNEIEVFLAEMAEALQNEFEILQMVA